MNRYYLIAISCLASLIVSGCAEGPLWRTGRYVPWVQEKWEAESQLAETLFARKEQLNVLVQSARNGSPADQAAAANRLSEVIQRDQVVLMKLHAVGLLGELNSAYAAEALRTASRDPDKRIRIAAIHSWKKFPGDVAVNALQDFIGSDTDIDVRLEAVKAIGHFADRAATNALAMALTDSNPAIQFRATESLRKVTGADIGADVAAWQDYLKASQSITATRPPDSSVR